MNTFPEFEQGDLPIAVSFAVAYLDGAMEDEAPEIARHWGKVREFVQSCAVEMSASSTDAGWLDIASAPKDGSAVWLFVNVTYDVSKVRSGKWSEKHQCWVCLDWKDRMVHHPGHQITHWRPLPVPPLPQVDTGPRRA